LPLNIDVVALEKEKAQRKIKNPLKKNGKLERERERER
jgi:hypothetical protein